jgi:serine/threonine protein kinase
MSNERYVQFAAKRRSATYKPTCSSSPSYDKSGIRDKTKIDFRKLNVQTKNPNYKIDYNRKIGEGGFGQVYLAHNIQNPSYPLVAKLLSKANVNEKSTMQEIEIGLSVEQENLVPVEYYEKDENLYIIFSEYFQGGDLSDYLNNLGGRFSECLSFLIFYQVTKGLKYLHKHHIAHLDLKLENIVYTDEEEMRIAIIDFGLSKEVPANGKLSGYRGTQGYLPAEVMENYERRKEYDPYKVDVFSLGVMFYVMLTGRFPFEEIRGEHKKKIPITETKIYKEMKKFPENIFERLRNKGFSEDLIEMLKGMLTPDTARRFSLRDVMTNPYYLNKLNELKNQNCRSVASPSNEMQSPTKHLDWINLQNSPERFHTNIIKSCNVANKNPVKHINEIDRIINDSQIRQDDLKNIITNINNLNNTLKRQIENVNNVKLQRFNSKSTAVQRLSSNEMLVKNLKRRYKNNNEKLKEYVMMVERFNEERKMDEENIKHNFNKVEMEMIKNNLMEEENLELEYNKVHQKAYELFNKELGIIRNLVTN